MATATWVDSNGDWSTGSNWSTGSAPGAGDDAVIPFGTVSLEAGVTVHSISVSTSSGALQISGQPDTVTTTLSNDGTVGVSGTSVSLGGTLNNSGTLNVAAIDQSIGEPPSVPATLTVGALNNTGIINISSTFGRFSAGPLAAATLDVLGPAPEILTGTIVVAGDALLEFASGSITTIASGSELEINSGIAGGGQAQVTNLSALTDNSGSLLIDPSVPLYGNGGTSVTLSGTLTNSGTLTIGNSQLNVAPSTLTVGGLDNTGAITLQGGTELATLDVLSAAPSTLTGDVTVGSNSLLEYASGSITAIASGATLDVAGSLALSGNTSSDTALSGLSSNAGVFGFSGNLTTNAGVNLVNSGTLSVYSGVLSLGGSLTNSNTISVIAGTLSVSGVVSNSGVVNITNGGLLDAAGYAYTQTAGSTTVNSGALSAAQVDIDSGALLFASALNASADTGTITVSESGLVEFGSFVASGQGVDFSNGGTIKIDQGGLFEGTIGGFTGRGDQLWLPNLSDADDDASISFNSANDQLTVTGDNGAVTLQLSAGNYNGVTWAAQPEGAGGTFVEPVAPGTSGYAQYSFIASEPVSLGETTDGNSPPPAVPGDFNIELVTSPNPADYPTETPYTTPSGYQGVALLLNGGSALDLLHGDYGVTDTSGGGDALVFGYAGTVDLSQIQGFASVLLSSNSANTAILPASLLSTAPGGDLALVGGNAGNTVASAGTAGETLSYLAGTGSDAFYGGGENDLVHVPVAALSGDTLHGGGGADTLYVEGSGTVALAGVSGFTNVILASDGANTVILSAAELAAAPGGALIVAGGNAGNIIASAGTSGHTLSYQAGTGTDQFYGGGEDDLVDVSDAALSGDALHGGSGVNELFITTPGTVNLTNVARFGTIDLSSAGANTLILSGPEIGAAGSKLTVLGGNSGNIIASGDYYHDTLSYDAGAGTDQFYGGWENDLVYVPLSALGNDTIEGGSGANGLFIEGAGPVNLSGVGGFGSVFLGSGGDNTLDLTNAEVAAAPGGALGLHAGNANDTIDASAVTDPALIVDFVGGAGNDTFIGGAGDDVFYFGGGLDTVTGGSGADDFIFNNTAGLPVSAMDQIITDYAPSQGDVIDLSQFAQGYTAQSNPNQYAQLTADPHGGLDLMFSAAGNGSFTEAAWLQSGDQGLSISQLVQAHNLLL